MVQNKEGSEASVVAKHAKQRQKRGHIHSDALLRLMASVQKTAEDVMDELYRETQLFDIKWEDLAIILKFEEEQGSDRGPPKCLLEAKGFLKDLMDSLQAAKARGYMVISLLYAPSDKVFKHTNLDPQVLKSWDSDIRKTLDQSSSRSACWSWGIMTSSLAQDIKVPLSRSKRRLELKVEELACMKSSFASSQQARVSGLRKLNKLNQKLKAWVKVFELTERFIEPLESSASKVKESFEISARPFSILSHCIAEDAKDNSLPSDSELL